MDQAQFVKQWRKRDSQRHKVYRWESNAVQPQPFFIGTMTLEEVTAMSARIWRAERARYNAQMPAGWKLPRADPVVELSPRNARGAMAYVGQHLMRFSHRAMMPEIVAHEVSHLLAGHGARHGPRFTGILIGVLCRHLGMQADKLLESARQFKVKVDRRVIGPVSAVKGADATQMLLNLLPCSLADAAATLDMSTQQVWGHALGLIRDGRAVYSGKVLRSPPGVDHEVDG